MFRVREKLAYFEVIINHNHIYGSIVSVRPLLRMHLKQEQYSKVILNCFTCYVLNFKVNCFTGLKMYIKARPLFEFKPNDHQHK